GSRRRPIARKRNRESLLAGRAGQRQRGPFGRCPADVLEVLLQLARALRIALRRAASGPNDRKRECREVLRGNSWASSHRAHDNLLEGRFGEQPWRSDEARGLPSASLEKAAEFGLTDRAAKRCAPDRPRKTGRLSARTMCVGRRLLG